MVSTRSFIIIISLLSIGLSACSVISLNRGAKRVESRDDKNLASMRAYESSVYPWVRTNCVSCHQDGPVPTFASGSLEKAHQVALGLVNFDHIEQSQLYIRSMNGHCGQQNCRTDGKAMHDGIALWKKLRDEYVAEPDPDLPGLPGLPGEAAFTCNPKNPIGPNPLRRLTKTEYVNTLIDLFGGAAVDGLQGQLPLIPDEVREEGFDNIARVISEPLVRGQFEVANTLAEYITSTDHTADLTRLFGMCIQGTTLQAVGCVRDFLTKGVFKLYRRPLRSEESAKLLAIFTDKGQADLKQGIKDLLVAALLSPHFLYRVETGLPGTSPVRDLSPFELATRLSYLFTGSTPDDELYAQASSGALTSNSVLRQQIDRLFASTKARLHITSHFFFDWLNLNERPSYQLSEDFLDGVSPTNLKTNAMSEMTELLRNHVWVKPSGLDTLFNSNQSFADTSNIAAIYQVPRWNPEGAPVFFPKGQRSGILTRVAFLANGSAQTAPFRLGNAVYGRLMCHKFQRPDPRTLPPGALELPPLDPRATKRQVLEAKTNDAKCMTCHQYINGPGFAAEGYDSLGRFRTHENDVAIETGVDFKMVNPDETKSVANLVELSEALSRHNRVYECFTLQYARYSYGREPGSSDSCSLEKVYTALRKQNGNIGEALKTLATLPQFRQLLIQPQ